MAQGQDGKGQANEIKLTDDRIKMKSFKIKTYEEV